MTPGPAGLQLATTVTGSGAPVIVIHGFTGSAAAMAPLVDRLDDYRRVAVDLVGHARSPSPPDLTHYSVEAMAASLHELAAAVTDGPCHIVGYSMGGRVALALAAAHPEVCRSLSLISATAGLADPAARAERRETDEALADRIGQRGLARFVNDWLALPMWDTLRACLEPDEWDASIRQRLGSNPVGLANSLRAAGTGSMTSLWDRLGDIAVPTLVLCGELDAKFVTIGRELASLLADSTLVVLAGTGHAVHLEDPDSSAAALREHFDIH